MIIAEANKSALITVCPGDFLLVESDGDFAVNPVSGDGFAQINQSGGRRIVGPFVGKTIVSIKSKKYVAKATLGVELQNSSAVTDNRIAVFGDSRVRQCSSLSGTTQGSENYGFIYWATFLSKQRARFHDKYNFGFSGYNTNQLVGAIDAVKRCPCGIVVILAGTNDRTEGLTDKDTIANLDKMISELTSVGKWVILIPETPRGDASNTSKRLSGTQLNYHLGVRKWCLEQRNRYNVKIADAWPDLISKTSTSADAAASVMHDGLHPATSGAYLIGKQVANRIIELIPYQPIIYPVSNADIYSAGSNNFGWINTNPMLDGTSGSAGTGGSGNVATGYTGSNSSAATNITRTYSKTSEGYQQVVIGGTAASGTGPSLDLLRITGLHTSVEAGRRVELLSEFDFAASSSNILSAQVGFTATDSGGSVNFWDGDRYTTDSKLNAEALSGVACTMPFLITEGLTDFRIRFTTYTADTAAAAGTVTIKSFGFRYVD